MKTASTVCLTLLCFLAYSEVFAKPPGGIPPGQAKKGAEEGIAITGSEDSVSVTKLTGWFRVQVVGTGKKCLVKEKDKTKSDKEQFGEFTDSEAFLKFFGEPECEEGDKGVAKGKIRASVVAQAYAKGPECLAKVLATVMDPEIKEHKVHTDVSVDVSAEATGDALALCESKAT